MTELLLLTKSRQKIEVKNMTELTNISTTRSTQNSFARSLIETSDGKRLFYQDWSTGKSVVFVHGWGLGGAILVEPLQIWE
jgi:hypothetical protein